MTSSPSTSGPREDEAVTVVTSRRVLPGREAEFEVWLDGIGRAAAAFPGMMGRRILRPRTAASNAALTARSAPKARTSFDVNSVHDQPDYVVVFKFDSYTHLRAWTESAERRAWLAKVEPLVTDPFRETILTGLERWFTLPGQPNLPPPTRFRMATVTLLVVYPLSYGLNALLGSWLAPLPGPLRSLTVSVLMIILLTWVVMPRATRLFRRWLYPGSS
jgi:uncharacterized protein